MCRGSRVGGPHTSTSAPSFAGQNIGQRYPGVQNVSDDGNFFPRTDLSFPDRESIQQRLGGMFMRAHRLH